MIFQQEVIPQLRRLLISSDILIKVHSVNSLNKFMDIAQVPYQRLFTDWSNLYVMCTNSTPVFRDRSSQKRLLNISTSSQHHVIQKGGHDLLLTSAIELEKTIEKYISGLD